MCVLLMQFQSELGQFSHTAGTASGWKSSRAATVLVLTIRQEAFLHFQEACSVFAAGCVYSTKQKPYLERNGITVYFSELRTALIDLEII